MTDPRAAVCLRGAVKGYGGEPVLSGVDLEVRAGELLGLRGANGAGKSTLLKLLAGLLEPDAGTCERDPALAGRVSYIPQDVALYRDLTVLEDLRFWAAVYGLPRKAADARSRWLLERLELTEKAHVPAGTCSGGQLRRLHLATGLVRTPGLLLLDEPTVGADERSAQLILSVLTDLRARGCATVLVSHRAGELEAVCDRIVCLEGGRLTGEVRP